MKRFFVFGLFLAFALAAPHRDQQRDRYEQQQQLDRYELLQQQDRYEQQQQDRYDQQQQQDRYDQQQQDRYDQQQQDRYDQQQQDRYDQQQQDRYDQQLQRDRYEQQQQDQDQEQYDRYQDQPLRYSSYGPLSTSVDLLAKELNYLSSKYGGQGVLKVSYSPPSQRADNSIVHDLGHLNLKYFSPYAYRAAPSLYGKGKKGHQREYLSSSLNLPNLNRVHHLEGQHRPLHDSHYHYDSRSSNYPSAYELSRILDLRNPDDEDDDQEQQEKKR